MAFLLPRLCHTKRRAAIHANGHFWVLLLFLAGTAPAWAETTPVRLQLKWQHQFQFAGYYAAQARGYYREAGLAVEILPCAPGEDCVQKVLDGRAEYGVGTTDLLLRREQGAPVVVLAVIFQHSPLALLTLQRSGVPSLHDLAGKRLMIEPGSAELLAYLNREGLAEDRYQAVPHGFSVGSLVDGQVDAMSVYLSDEPFALSEAKHPFVLYSPRSGGIDFYGDNLFTTQARLQSDPEQVRAFRAASLRGWRYAMEHPQEIAELIFNYYSRRHSLPHLLYEAEQMASLLQTDLVEPGHMYEGRWRHIAEVYGELGMLKGAVDFDGFLYNAEPVPAKLTWLFISLGALAVLLALAGAVAYYVLRINRSLQASEQRWHYLFDAAPLALIVSDPADRVIRWNAAASRLFGWTAQEAIGREMITLLVPEAERAHVQGVMERTLQEGGITYSLNRNRTKSGEILTCEWHNTLYHAADGPAAGTISIGTDVSERILAQERLKQAKDIAEQLLADQRQFLAMLSHEIRSPLATVSSAAQLLQLRCATACGDSEVVERIQRGVRRLAAFVSNCLSEERLAQIEESGLRRLDENIALDELVRIAWEQASQAAPTRPIQLSCPAPLGSYRGDPQLLRVMLDNLLDNACKYSPIDSRVVLYAARNTRRMPVFIVEDQGMGIAPEEREKITSRYFRGKNALQTNGAGLGLFLVQRIVNLHQGELQIDSHPGQGTCITVRLPAPTTPGDAG